MKFYSGLLLTSLLALAGCAVNPVTGDRDFALVSEDEEIKQGRRFHRTIIAQYGVYDDPDLQAYVDDIGQRLAQTSHRSDLQFHFTVLDSAEINAFALPGGYVYITRGIMAYLDSEAELAGVLGHEIGHVTARHSVRQQGGQFASDLLGILIAATTGNDQLASASQTIGTGIVRGYGRDHELEADRLGAEYLHNIGHDPEVMLGVIGVLKDQEVFERAQAKREGREPNIYHGVFSTHPRNDERLKTVIRAARKLPAAGYRDAGRERYHARIDGMLWGASARQGVLRANRFAHPELRFALTLPSGWRSVNHSEYLQTSHPDTGALVRAGLVKREKDESAAALLRRIGRDADLAVDPIDGGASAQVEVRAANGSRQPARLSTVLLNDRQALTLMATAPGIEFELAEPEFLAIERSFRRLDADEAASIEFPRIRILGAERPSSYSALARASALDKDAESRLRLLNRDFPSGDIAARDRVKQVVWDE